MGKANKTAEQFSQYCQSPKFSII